MTFVQFNLVMAPICFGLIMLECKTQRQRVSLFSLIINIVMSCIPVLNLSLSCIFLLCYLGELRELIANHNVMSKTVIDFSKSKRGR